MTDDVREHKLISRLREQAQRYIDGLRQQLEAHHALSEKAHEQLQALRQQMDMRDDEIQKLHDHVSSMRAELAARTEEQDKLRDKLLQVSQLRDESNDEYRAIQDQIGSLSSLYVASYSLHGTADRARVLSAIDQILINLIGSETYGVYELDESGKSLSLCTSMGIDAQRWKRLSVDDVMVLECIATGKHHVQADPEGEPRACIPLLLDGRLMGVVVIFQLLTHKSGLVDLDFELFDLLASHAASALSLSRLYPTEPQRSVA